MSETRIKTRPRQQVRREMFLAAFESMPLWETWTEGRVNKNGEEAERGNFRGIPRRIRRDMARQKAKREFRALASLKHGKI